MVNPPYQREIDKAVQAERRRCLNLVLHFIEPAQDTDMAFRRTMNLVLEHVFEAILRGHHAPEKSMRLIEVKT